MKRCHVCGRQGTKQFRLIPETTITAFGPPFTVGGWWECSAKKACWRRFDLLSPRSREYAA
jgi:thymidine kinase